MSDPRLILFEALEPFLSRESHSRIQANADIIDQRLAAAGFMRSLYADREKLQAESAEYRRCLEIFLCDAGHALRPAIKKAIGLEYLEVFEAQTKARDAVVEAARAALIHLDNYLIGNMENDELAIFNRRLEEALQAYDESGK